MKGVGDSKPRKANVRVIAATNRRLEDLLKEGKFREDLYYRLNVITVELPPLRQRPLDLPSLAEQHLRLFAKQSGRSIKGFTPAAMSAMQRYPWPGNLRELRNVIERAVILTPGDKIDLNDFPKICAARSRPGPRSAIGSAWRIWNGNTFCASLKLRAAWTKRPKFSELIPPRFTGNANAMRKPPSRRHLPRPRPSPLPRVIPPCCALVLPSGWCACWSSCFRWDFIPSTNAGNWAVISRP